MQLSGSRRPRKLVVAVLNKLALSSLLRVQRMRLGFCASQTLKR